jgi:23S rRNA (guanosine2251-2'-O)-methyltransferase
MSRSREPRVVFGFHAVLARLRAAPRSVLEIYLDETRQDGRVRDLVAVAERSGVRLMRVPTKRLDGFYGGGRHQGVVARVEVKSAGESVDEVLESVENALLLLLDGVTDPHNLGACLRVANAAGVHAVIAPKDRSAGITPAVSKVASGAAESTPYLMVTNLARTLDEIKERNIWVVGADERAEKTLYEADLPGSIAWVLGAEGEGMRRLTRESCDLLVRIPMSGDVESLNVSVSAGICLFESVRRRKKEAAK